MECEQGGFLEHQIALLSELGDIPKNCFDKAHLTAATERVAAMLVAGTNEMKLPDQRIAIDLQARNNSFHSHSLPLPPSLPPKLWSAPNAIDPHGSYSKELRLLMHVSVAAHMGDPASVCQAVENFGEEALGSSGLHLKVAAGRKAEVLIDVLHTATLHGCILEIGTYCGFSAIRMVLACPHVFIVTLERDPAHVIIARNMIAFAGLARVVDVNTGHSRDLLPRLSRCHTVPPPSLF